ncbi:polysaccharide biosynthesis/export family protein [Roseofilum capinflatum]|uniref:Polysaccharide biosynthesis/export family protein n=1 Tax=Roseofilum capinflatum BLCC-M114 TaxID=3022440 RepID=A0ABT7BAZ8_9CYAN|nr:polysaccharide biosynthesis/export family protein [Roseofilum capinflatum]MDJ1175493.1 polysaccharide biosynthesis/export family protein [Roseofilum capinflatum BLCC-M114]
MFILLYNFQFLIFCGYIVFALFLDIRLASAQFHADDSQNSARSISVSPFTSIPREYYLGAGDTINVDILGVPELSGRYDILSDGSISLPLIGRIVIEGFTIPEAITEITVRYRLVMKNPVISLRVAFPRPINVGVIGEVNRPGTYTIRLTPGVGANPSAQYPTVSQAIKLAEGITQAANLREIEVHRYHRSGQIEKISLNLWDFLHKGKLNQDIILQDGDTIIIPTLTEVDLVEARSLALTSFSPATDVPRSIAVIGEVNRPGPYVLVGGNTTTQLRTLGLPTVTRAIQLAGGIKPKANIREIKIRRLTRSGTEQYITVNLWALLDEGDLKQDTILQDGDTVIVPTATELRSSEAIALGNVNFAPETIQVYVVGEVRGERASRIEVPPDTTLNQALLAFGSFGYDNVRVRRGSVKLLRLNPNGTVSSRSIVVNLNQGLNEETNPQLRNNDIIVVDRNLLTKISDGLQLLVRPVAQGSSVLNFIGLLDNLFNIINQEN